ncbi:MAG: MmcQ/YjbR family DNA-binding protein [Actinomycetota bacterium]|nr:MmcQ/YjbR family DNA-binding protein [Actinomycetota bacterium]
MDGGTEDEEVLAGIRSICLSLDGVEEGALQDRPLFCVGRRRFAIFNGSESPRRPRWIDAGRSLHFLPEPAERDALRNDLRFGPSPHHGDRGWLSLRLESAIDWDEVAELLQAAYAQVSRRS